MISHASPQKRDIRYDHQQQRFIVLITLHHLDGTSEPTELRLGPDEMAALSVQVEQSAEKRAKALGLNRDFHQARLR
ncbi:hypothetical protein [Streptomyces orinoci]|uniref:DUF2283 domain-containing protein n=1 Tax=Streptomyces orinoci TaxID=67339 RepID=A0ABV3JWT9_STRON|nr:hypothetical protein [Streptomyces orinoci]